MNIKDRIETVLMVFLVSFGVSDWVVKDSLDNLHCQPITTHSTIEEAKAKVREYQGNES